MDKHSLRKTKIFAVLDQAKEDGEKMTAQLLAARVNMGKQTVLPFYREWQELQAIGASEKIEIPSDFEHAIKRLIAREVFKAAEITDRLEDQLEDEKKAHFDTKKKLADQACELHTATDSLKQLDTHIQAQENVISEKKGQIQTLQDRLSDYKEQILMQHNKTAQLEEEKLVALKEQENRLDRSHQQLLNHWMSALDVEKQEKGKLTKQLQVAWEKIKKAEQKISELDFQVGRLMADADSLTNKLTEFKTEAGKMAAAKQQSEEILSRVQQRLDCTDHADIERKLAELPDLRELVKQKNEQISDLRKQSAHDQHLLKQLTQLKVENSGLKLKVTEQEYFIKGLTGRLSLQRESFLPTEQEEDK